MTPSRMSFTRCFDLIRISSGAAIMDIDLPNQFMLIDNLDFIESLAINRQHDALNGIQEKQPVGTHLGGEAVHRTSNVVCRCFPHGNVAPLGLPRVSERYSNNGPVERAIPSCVNERKAMQLVGHGLIHGRSWKIIVRTSGRIEDSRPRMVRVKEK